MKPWIWITLAVVLICVIGVTIVLTQTKPAITKTQTVTLSVKPAPDFTLAVTPPAIDTPVGRTVGYVATVTSVNNFAGDVNFTTSTLPTGFTVTILPSNKLTLGPDTPRSVQINIDIAASAPVGDYTITVTAESTVYN